MTNKRHPYYSDKCPLSPSWQTWLVAAQQATDSVWKQPSGSLHVSAWVVEVGQIDLLHSGASWHMGRAVSDDKQCESLLTFPKLTRVTCNCCNGKLTCEWFKRTLFLVMRLFERFASSWMIVVYFRTIDFQINHINRSCLITHVTFNTQSHLTTILTKMSAAHCLKISFFMIIFAFATVK